MSKDTFGVKLIYKYVVHSQNSKVLYEEQILKIHADSFDDAYEKAEKYIESYIDKYININGDTVEISLYKVVDCFKCYDEENDVQEVYSGFLNLCEDELSAITTSCEIEQINMLRHI